MSQCLRDRDKLTYDLPFVNLSSSHVLSEKLEFSVLPFFKQNIVLRGLGQPKLNIILHINILQCYVFCWNRESDYLFVLLLRVFMQIFTRQTNAIIEQWF